jgi:hypothetical protein
VNNHIFECKIDENLCLIFDFLNMNVFNGFKKIKIQINEHSVVWQSEQVIAGILKESDNWWYFGKNIQKEVLSAYKKYLISKAIKDKLSE